MKIYTRTILIMAVFLLAACGTPRLAYFQDLNDGATLKTEKSATIRLKPADQISVIVNSRDPQVTAMFNLPYYSKQIGGSQSLTAGSSISVSQSSAISGYTIDSQGYIDFPVLGKILVAELTREEAAEHIKDELLESRQIKDPVVIVEYMNLGFSVLGEVNHPGRYKIDRDRFTVLDAISLAGDLTIDGMRDNVLLIRHEGRREHTYLLDLTDARQLYASPAFYIQQEDVIYVTPNEKRSRESTVNGNAVRTTSFWLTLSSLLTSIAVLVFNILKY